MNDDILKIAEEYEARHDLASAVQAYSDYLKSNPYDVRVMEKIMVLTCGLTDINELKKKEVLESFQGDPSLCRWVFDVPFNPGAARLEKVYNLLCDASGYVRCSKKCEELERKATFLKHKQDAIENDSEPAKDQSAPRIGKFLFFLTVILPFIGFFFAGIFVIVGFQYLSSGTPAGLVVSLIFAGVVAGAGMIPALIKYFAFDRPRKVKAFENAQESSSITLELNSILKEYEETESEKRHHLKNIQDF